MERFLLCFKYETKARFDDAAHGDISQDHERAAMGGAIAGEWPAAEDEYPLPLATTEAALVVG